MIPIPSALPEMHPEIAGVNLLLAVVSPLQNLLDQPSITHEFLNKQAITILANDGLKRCAQLLQSFTLELNAGVYWADKGWKNVSHYYEPLTGKGLWRFPTALDDFSLYFQAAVAAANQNALAKSIFFLGAAAHLLQDLCVPHHARAKLFSGHKEYENWVKTHHYNFAATDQGIYNNGKNLSQLLITNALTAADLLDWVLEENHTRFHTVTTILLPLAERSTAGLFEHFCTITDIVPKERFF